jgi:hypothetical protein
MIKHISRSLAVISRELEEAKKRHPTAYREDDDGDRTIERIAPGVLYFRKRAG